MAKSRSLKFRIVALSLFVCLVFTAVTAWQIVRFRGELVRAHFDQIKVAAEMAATVINGHVDLAKSGLVTEEAAKRNAVEAVRNLRYMGQEYFWINDTSPRMVMHPIKRELDGQDLTNDKDPDGKRLFVEMAEKAKRDGSGFVEYLWPKPGEKDPVPKISFVKLVPEWGWVVGTGVYTGDVTRDVIRTVWFACLALLVCILGCVLFSVLLANRVSHPLRRSIAELNEGTRQMAEASGSVSSVSQLLAAGASSQAASVEETSAAMTEISSMTRQNSGNSGEARRLAQLATEEVERANDSMASVVRQMNDIAGIGQEVGKIIKTIDEIAFQTNLLALNAAVEAARAGEAGAGFAVVADEVRNLAQRAAGAAKNTAELIETTIRKITDGTGLVERTNGDFHGVAQAVRKVNELVGEISAATAEQDRGIGEIGTGLGEVDRVTQEVAASAEEIASAAEELSAHAESLDRIVEDIRHLIEGYAGMAAEELPSLPAAAPHVGGGSGRVGMLHAPPSAAARRKAMAPARL
jgi:methyl-accepting chemotaxis protein